MENPTKPDAAQEIIALWTRVHGEPPPIRSDVPLMVKVLVEALPIPIGPEC
jgi:hypothetical protein